MNRTLRTNARRRSTTSFTPTEATEPQPGQNWRRRGAEGTVRIVSVGDEIEFTLRQGRTIKLSPAEFLRLFVVTAEGGESDDN